MALKTEIGKGFVLSVDTPENGNVIDLDGSESGLIVREAKGKKMYFTGTTNYAPIRRLVETLERQRAAGRDVRYQVNSATLEQVFLDLNAEKAEEGDVFESQIPGLPAKEGDIEMVPVSTSGSESDDLDKTAQNSEKDLEAPTVHPPNHAATTLALSHGRKRNNILAIPIDASTIFVKRFMVFRRAWLLPLIGLVVTIAAATIPLGYMTGRIQTCQLEIRNRRLQRLSYPYSIYPLAFTPVVLTPTPLLSAYPAVLPIIRQVSDNTTFVNTFAEEITNISYGGVSLSNNPGSETSLFAYEASPFLQKGQSVLNFLSNSILNSVSPPDITGLGIGQVQKLFRIDLSFRFMAAPDFTSTAQAIKWVGFL